jgi:diguanylate cyclase (GGDEF)-like protein/putative nucleotidyltransferase with HDIG domain
MSKKRIFVNYIRTLEFKVRISLIIIALVPLIIYFVINNIQLRNNFLILEKENIQSKSQQVNAILKRKSLELENMAKDYAIWDEAYEKIKEKDTKWFKENYSDWLSSTQNIDLVAVINREKKLTDGYSEDSSSILKLIQNSVINDSLNGDFDREMDVYPNGLIQYQGNLYFLGICPIINSNYEKPSHGVVILGRKVTTKMLKEIKDEFGYNISISYGNNIISLPDEYQHIKTFFKSMSEKPYTNDIQVGDSKITGSQSLYDISSNRVGYFFITDSRNMFLSTLNIIYRSGFIVSLFSIIAILILIFMLRKLIINPIRNLKFQISEMVRSDKLGYLNVDGSDEIADLASAFNHMTSNILNQKVENTSLKTLSVTDNLTGLYNHRYFFEYFQNILANKSKQITLLFCDIDHFKIVNDTKGHVVGDLILKKVSEIIKEAIGEYGEVFRYGGEEFVVLINCSKPDLAYNIAEKIRLRVYNSKELQNSCGYTPITISIGLAKYPTDAFTLEDLVDKADKAMYYAKQNGRNQCCVYDARLDKLINIISEDFIRQEMLLDSVYALSSAIDAKDTYTEKHSESVVKYSLLLANEMKMSENQMCAIKIGGLLHDCGKIGIPGNIIHKPGSLTAQEYDVIRNHTVLGSNIVKYIIKTPEIGACIRNHHERWDGKGYPDGLMGESIPISARMICIADSYHAMISDRPYRKALGQDKALQELEKGKGTQFDPELVDIFINAIQKASDELPTSSIA